MVSNIFFEKVNVFSNTATVLLFGSKVGSRVFQNYYRLPCVYDCRRSKVDFIPFARRPCAARTSLLTYYRFDRVVVATAWRKGNGARGRRRTYHQYFHRSRAGRGK